MLDAAHKALSRGIPIATAGDPGISRRDLRLDMFRGLALVMIYINHVPGTVFENLTSRNFGFSDAAEAFVLMSGIAAGLAYSGSPPPDLPLRNARRAWARSWTLYMTHIVTTMMAIGVSAAAARWFGAPEMVERNNIAPFFDDLTGVMIGIPALTHQLGYFNILPLYAVLIAVTPALIWVGKRYPVALIAGSLAVWAMAGETRTNFPAFPNPGGWFFNPFSWQLIFIIGLVTGMALKNGARLVPVTRPLIYTTIGFLVVSLIWLRVPFIGLAGRETLHAGFNAGLPFWVVGFDKTFLTLPRLLHVLAIAYVVSALPVFRDIAESRWTRPLVMMGRHGLPVFATGSVLCIVGQSIKAATAGGFILDAWIIAGGILIQVGVAVVLTRLAATRAARTA